MNFYKGIIANRFLIKNIVLRDIKQRYTGSLFGAFWVFFQPIATALIYTFVFSFVLKAKLGPEYGGLNFSLWLLSGLIPWMLFNEIINRAPAILLDNASLIKKTLIDSQYLVISNIITGLVNFFVFFFIMDIFLIIFGVPFTFHVLVALIYIIILCGFSLGLSYILAAVNVYLRDVGQILGVALNIWFYFTPIIYPITLIPENARFYIELNPLYHLIEGFRDAVVLGQPINISSVFYSGIFAVIFLVIGKKVFNKLKDGFVDVL